MQTSETLSQSIVRQERDEFSHLCDGLRAFNRPLTFEEIGNTLSSLSLCLDDLAIFTRFDEESYARNRILRTQFVDLLVLCWRPRQRTPIHDHGGSTCGVYVIEGSCSEVGFTDSDAGLLLPTKIQTLSTGDLSISRDADIHMLGNFSAGADLVTLHCYSPPLARMNTYSSDNTFLADYDGIASRAAASGCYQIVR